MTDEQKEQKKKELLEVMNNNKALIDQIWLRPARKAAELNRSFKHKFMMKFSGNKTYRAHIMHSNGTISSHIIKARDVDSFKLKGNTYVIDEDVAKWSNTFKCWELWYHESCAMPVPFDIKAHDIMTPELQESMKASGLELSAVNPRTLTHKLEYQWTYAIMQGAKFKILGALAIAGFGCLIVSIIHLALFYSKFMG